MGTRIITPNGEVIHSLNPSATIAKLMEAKATPATYDAQGKELTPHIEADPATVYEVVDEADVDAHKWIAPKRLAEAETAMRAKRDRLLAESDWTQLGDAPLGNKAGWSAYRQALRDLPENTVDPKKPSWPVAP